jgi:DUF177 domain-containing protein
MLMSRLAVELSTIPPEGVLRAFTSTGVELGIDAAELAMVQPVELECWLYKVNDEVVVHGSLRSSLSLTCSRCAEEFQKALSVALDTVYLPTGELSSARAKELEEGETDVYAYTDQVIDIATMVRDKLLLSIPLQPHCTLGCKGLCPTCGVNRNVVTCQCSEARLGSPFEALKDLRARGRDEE